MNPLGDSVPTEPAPPAKRKRMVVGFVFSYPATCVGERVERAAGDPLVLLVKKSEPLWQRGKWNGPGGANFFDEDNKTAMSRELREETGLEIDADEWEVVAFLKGSDFEVCVLASMLPLGAIHLSPLDEDEAKALGREYYRWHEIGRLPSDVIYDVRWLVPLALDGRFYPLHCDVKPICEHKSVPDAPAVIGGRETDEPESAEAERLAAFKAKVEARERTDQTGGAPLPIPFPPAEAEKFPPASCEPVGFSPATAELMAKLEAAEAANAPTTGNAVGRCSARAVEITRAIETEAAKSAGEVADAIKAGPPRRGVLPGPGDDNGPKTGGTVLPKG